MKKMRATGLVSQRCQMKKLRQQLSKLQVYFTKKKFKFYFKSE